MSIPGYTESVEPWHCFGPISPDDACSSSCPDALLSCMDSRRIGFSRQYGELLKGPRGFEILDYLLWLEWRGSQSEAIAAD